MEIRVKFKENAEEQPLGEVLSIPMPYSSCTSWTFERDDDTNERYFAIYVWEAFENDVLEPIGKPKYRLFMQKDMCWDTYFKWLNTQVEFILEDGVQIYPAPSKEQ